MEEKGFRTNHIVGWKKFNNEQRQIVLRIWEYVGEKAKKQYQIDTLIAKQQLEMEEKIQIKEKITKCLEIYCQNACDKQKYLKYLADMDKELEDGIVRSIVIPDAIRVFLPLADRLNPLEKLHAWKTYLAENREVKTSADVVNPTTDMSSFDIIDDDSLLSDDSK